MQLNAGQQLALLHTMWQIRFFEEQAMRLYGEGYFRGSTHPYIAQEATAVGVCATLDPHDKVLATYRGHGAAIAKGADLGPLMAELLGRATGVCKGKGGSMHLADVSRGFVGCNAIVAAHIPIAGGIALAEQLDRSGAVVVCFFGDGASCQGLFYETCNMAVLWKLPLILVVENNGFAISTHVSESISVPDISMRAKGFGFPGVTIDGNDLPAVYATASEAVARARRGEGPTLIEAKTVRWSRHSAVSAGGYGSNKESERWRTVDPIVRFRDTLVEQHMLTETEASQIEEQARHEIDAAVAFAIDSPLPAPESIYEDIFA